MMHIAYYPLFPKKILIPLFPQNLYISPPIPQNLLFCVLNLRLLLPPILTMMHHALYVLYDAALMLHKNITDCE